MLRISLILAVVALGTFIPGAEAARLSIDTETRAQRMFGFGASGCWWINWFHRMPADKQERALDLLFTDEGAGLDIYRHNLPSASGDDVLNARRRSADVETAPLEFDLARDQKNMDVLKRVLDRGVERVTLFSNSPPRRLTANGKTSGGDGGGSNLRDGAEAEFAEYLVLLSQQILDETGLEQASLSPVNEPQWRWGQEDRRRWQEGCHYTPEGTRRMARALIDELDRTGEARLIPELFDSGSWAATPEYAEAVWSDPVIRERVGTISVHSYWSSAKNKRDAARALRERLPGIEIRMTEYCEMRGGHDPGMRSGLHVARVIHEDLTIGDVTEWTWWLGMSSSRFCDGLIHYWLRPQEMVTTKRLWALAHWSRFVEPGWERVGASDGAEPDSEGAPLLISAFRSPDGEQVVAVVVNEHETSEPVTWLIDDVESFASEVFITDDTRDLEPVALSDAARAEVPPRSIMTFRFEQTVRQGDDP